jgi:hypothetical protein
MIKIDLSKQLRNMTVRILVFLSISAITSSGSLIIEKKVSAEPKLGGCPWPCAQPSQPVSLPYELAYQPYCNEHWLCYCLTGKFSDYWNDHGQLQMFGIPYTTIINEEIDGDMYLVQYTERARFEWHPKLPKKFQVSLGRLGYLAAQGRTDAPFQPINDPHNGLQWFSETKHTLGDKTEGGQAIAKFWREKGGLSQFGFPLSQPFTEATTSTDANFAGKSFLVQYFERQRLEFHPENKISAPAYVILLGALGKERFDRLYPNCKP